MELGYSITSSYSDDLGADRAAAAVLDRAEAAASAGYDSIEAGDHHAMGGDGGYLQNVPTAARLTEHFDRVAVMFLLPLYHPVLVAEQAGTIASFVDEIDFWCAVGRADGQYDAFGVPAERRGARFVESLELVKRLWREDDVTHRGEHWTVEDLSIAPKADARFCLGGTAEIAVRRAGHRGDAWVANADASPAYLEEARRWFESEGGGELIVRRDALALTDGERAEAIAHEKLADGYRGWTPEADWVLAGDAESVAEDLVALRELGVDEVVVRPMSDRHAVETLETVAQARDHV